MGRALTRTNIILTLLVVGLSVLVAQTALRMERYNLLAAKGGDSHAAQASGTSGTNAAPSFLPDEDDRFRIFPDGGDEAGGEEPTDAQRRRATYREKLRELMSTRGLLQYPGVILLLILSLWLFFKVAVRVLKFVAMVGVLIALAGAGLMVYRNYFAAGGP